MARESERHSGSRSDKDLAGIGRDPICYPGSQPDEIIVESVPTDSGASGPNYAPDPGFDPVDSRFSETTNDL